MSLIFFFRAQFRVLSDFKSGFAGNVKPKLWIAKKKKRGLTLFFFLVWSLSYMFYWKGLALSNEPIPFKPQHFVCFCFFFWLNRFFCFFFSGTACTFWWNSPIKMERLVIFCLSPFLFLSFLFRWTSFWRSRWPAGCPSWKSFLEVTPPTPRTFCFATASRIREGGGSLKGKKLFTCLLSYRPSVWNMFSFFG